jgi:general secretion pathway protein A
MYKHFFGLRENPFNVNPDPRYLFLTPQTQEALDELTYGIRTRKGLILLTGEVGTGKTTLINRLLDWLRQQQTPTAFIFNSHLGIGHLFDFIFADFGLCFDSQTNNNALMLLNQWLFERYRAGDTPVLIVDEAQGLPTHVLEEIRMLLNLETSREKLLQIVLAGQPELEERLKRPDLRQIKQRIALRCKTAALTLHEAHDYIHARLHIAGANGKAVFTSEAIDAVHVYSRGIPRIMNLLCEHALINAYVDHVQPVPMHIIAEVAREFQFDDIKSSASSLESRDMLDSKLIAPQSTLINVMASLPAAAELPCMEQSPALTTCASVLFDLKQGASSPIKESAAQSFHFEGIPDPKGNAEESKLHGAQVTGTTALRPCRTSTSQPSGLTVLLNHVGVLLFSGLAKKPKLPAYPTPIHEIKTNEGFEYSGSVNCHRTTNSQWSEHLSASGNAWESGPFSSNAVKTITSRLFLASVSTMRRIRVLPTVAPRDAGRWVTILLQRSKQTFHALLELFRGFLTWIDRCLCKVDAIDWVKTKASAYRWLNHPWKPTL